MNEVTFENSEMSIRNIVFAYINFSNLQGAYLFIGKYRKAAKMEKKLYKQIFVLTHNAYFHKEVTYNQVNRYQWVSFYFIGKLDNHSSIKLCTRENKTELENFNPVQNSYAALWSEYREVQSPIPVLNVIRRILEYYFLQICGYDGTNMRKTILEDHKEQFIQPGDDGQPDYTQFHMATAMLSYLSTGTTGIVDGLNFVDECMDVEQCRETFEMIFRYMHQVQHFDMMMGNTNRNQNKETNY